MRREICRRKSLRGTSPVEDAAMVLIDSAAQICPSSATRALHVGMYAARIGRAMSLKTPPRELWVLGALSVLAPNSAATDVIFSKYSGTLAIFAGKSVIQNDDVHADILKVAHAFEDGVEQSTSDRGESSPADTLRIMMRDRIAFAPLVVAALRRALAHPSQSLWATPTAHAA